MWWVLILKKIRIMPFNFFFFGGGCGEGGGGSSPSQNIFNPFTP